MHADTCTNAYMPCSSGSAACVQWSNIAGRSLVAQGNGGLSDHVTKSWEPS